jgi:peptidoglycan-N-acetylglucosamine deacetylase
LFEPPNVVSNDFHKERNPPLRPQRIAPPKNEETVSFDISRRQLLTGALVSVLPRQVRPSLSRSRVVALTFDDGPVSQATFVAPLLKTYGFRATFFVCEFPPNFADKTLYMSWEQIASLHQMGFEVGNHTMSHRSVLGQSTDEFARDLEALQNKASSFGIPQMVSFAYPGYGYNEAAIQVIKDHGYKFARAGLDRIYDPATDNRYIIPGFTATATNRQLIIDALRHAEHGNVPVLTFHGIPDIEHPWVNTPPELFEEYLQFLRDGDYTVIALRDLAAYLD